MLGELRGESGIKLEGIRYWRIWREFDDRGVGGRRESQAVGDLRVGESQALVS